jgi:hypothetical protein
MGQMPFFSLPILHFTLNFMEDCIGSVLEMEKGLMPGLSAQRAESI